MVLSLLGSNVQSTYYEQILLAVAEKLYADLKRIPETDNRLRLNCISSPGLEETDRSLIQEDQETDIVQDHHQEDHAERKLQRIRRRTEDPDPADPYFSTESLSSFHPHGPFIH